MLKQFNSIWKNATLKKFQIILRRFASSASVVQVHVNQLSTLNQSSCAKKFLQPNPYFLPSATNLCEKHITVRCINSQISQETNLERSENVNSKYKQMEANLKWRADPVIATLDTPQFKSILRKNILDLVALFQKYNYEIRIAGGAVR